MPVSAVSPAILVSEIEIEKKAKSNDRPPLLPEPTRMETRREAQVKRLVIRQPSVGGRRGRCWSQQAQPPAADPIFQAMHDEIERARQDVAAESGAALFRAVPDRRSDELQRVGQPRRPAFARRDDGSRAGSQHSRRRLQDSTTRNFAGGGFNFGSRYDLERFPLENSYPRAAPLLVAETDSAYKSAVEAISRKRAALRNHHAERAAQRFRPRRAGEAHPRRSQR